MDRFALWSNVCDYAGQLCGRLVNRVILWIKEISNDMFIRELCLLGRNPDELSLAAWVDGRMVSTTTDSWRAESNEVFYSFTILYDNLNGKYKRSSVRFLLLPALSNVQEHSNMFINVMRRFKLDKKPVTLQRTQELVPKDNYNMLRRKYIALYGNGSWDDAVFNAASCMKKERSTYVIF